MKAAIINQYLDTLGGGERYTMSFALALDELGYQVDLEWSEDDILQRLEDRFDLKLKNTKVVKDIKKGEDYDVCFWVSDGSIPLLRARKNFLHFQMPFTNVDGKTLLNRMKMFRINKIICNSYFTKNFIDEEYYGDKMVLYPPVSVDKFKPGKKENLIVYLGRFSQLTQSKGQDLLVDRFKAFYDSGYSDWKMILMGGVEVGVDNFVEDLREMAKGYPVRIIESPSFSEIQEILGKAKLFWSAAGYGYNEEKHPEKVEHFGITTVEAMASGAVPIVYKAGGQKEIIINNENGYLWEERNELIKITKNYIKDKNLMNKIVKKAVADSRVYEYERFKAEILQILR